METYFSGLFEYNRQNNRLLMERVATLPAGQEDPALRLICHILNAQEIWNQRILGQSPRCTVWQLHSFEEQQALNEENYQDALQILQHKPLQYPVSYTNTRGENFENSVGDILFHVMNHSTHHRAQLVTLLKQAGIDIPPTDYIFYKRQHPEAT